MNLDVYRFNGHCYYDLYAFTDLLQLPKKVYHRPRHFVRFARTRSNHYLFAFLSQGKYKITTDQKNPARKDRLFIRSRWANKWYQEHPEYHHPEKSEPKAYPEGEAMSASEFSESQPEKTTSTTPIVPAKEVIEKDPQVQAESHDLPSQAESLFQAHSLYQEVTRLKEMLAVKNQLISRMEEALQDKTTMIQMLQEKP